MILFWLCVPWRLILNDEMTNLHLLNSKRNVVQIGSSKKLSNEKISIEKISNKTDSNGAFSKIGQTEIQTDSDKAPLNPHKIFLNEANTNEAPNTETHHKKTPFEGTNLYRHLSDETDSRASQSHIPYQVDAVDETNLVEESKRQKSSSQKENAFDVHNIAHSTVEFLNSINLEEPILMKRGLNEIFACRHIGDFFRIIRHQSSCFRCKDFFVRSPSQRSYPDIEFVDKKNIEELQRAQSNNRTPKISEGSGDFKDKRGQIRTKEKWPIMYSTNYAVHFWGIEKLHPFDVAKWGNIFAILKSQGMLTEESIFEPEEVTEEILLLAHTRWYLRSLQSSSNVAKITELPCIAALRPEVVNQRYLKPMRFQVGGSILAGELALHRGWAINIGGGFHHACGYRGGGFCPYADITLLIKWLFKFYPEYVKTAMIVDLDAHQGNGHEKDFLDNKQVFIMDVYNKNIYPWDYLAQHAIRRKIELESHTADDLYLELVEKNLEISLQEFHPDILVYNAGTDILQRDSLGKLDVSGEGIIKRDAIVFTKARARCIPIVMVTSGGYLRKTADIIARSILNLEKLKLIAR